MKFRSILPSEASALAVVFVVGISGGCSGDGSPAEPPPITPTSIQVSPQSATLEAFGHLPIEARVIGSDGSTMRERSVTWASGNAELLTVSPTGGTTAELEAGAGPGVVTVTARLGTMSGSAVVTILSADVDSVSISAPATTLLVADTFTLSATAFGAGGRALSGVPLAWSSSDNAIASVDSQGLVAGNSPGVAEIRAIAPGDVTASVSITVTERPLASLHLGPELPRVEEGKVLHLALTARDDLGRVVQPPAAVEWIVTEPAVASITDAGEAKGLAAGTTHVTVAFGGISAERILVVTSGDEMPDPDRSRALAALVEISESGEWYPSHFALQSVIDAGHSTPQWSNLIENFLATSVAGTDAALYIDWLYSTQTSPQARSFREGVAHAAFIDIPQWTVPSAEFLGVLSRNPTLEGRLHFSGVVGRFFPPSPESLASIRALILDLGPDAMGTPGLRTWTGTVYFEAFTRSDRTASRIEELVSELRLSGQVAAILRDHGVLVADYCIEYGDKYCGRLDNQALGVIGSVLAGVDRDLYRGHIILVENSLGFDLRFTLCCFFHAGRGPGVSIGSHANSIVENPFPPDGPVHTYAWFNTVLHHELAHEIDYFLYVTSARYRLDRDRLIADAGVQNGQYLRGDLDPAENAFFKNHPRELLSALSQQWLAASEATLLHGLGRWDRGYREPVRQALWLAEVYSSGGSTAPIYSTAPDGRLIREDAPIERNGAGYITRIDIGGRIYSFGRSTTGQVTSVTRP